MKTALVWNDMRVTKVSFLGEININTKQRISHLQWENKLPDILQNPKWKCKIPQTLLKHFLLSYIYC